MGKLDGSEIVLAVPAAFVHRFGPWTGWHGTDSRDLDAIIAKAAWVPRTQELENDTSQLQIISYGSVWDLIGGVMKVLVYRRARAGTEVRLHDLLSLGIGGHVEQQDDISELITAEYAAMRREIREEIGVNGIISFRRGMIYDERWTGVNAVHFGVYLENYVAKKEIDALVYENSIDIVGWWSKEDIRLNFGSHGDDWETWSQVVIKHRILKGEFA